MKKLRRSFRNLDIRKYGCSSGHECEDDGSNATEAYSRLEEVESSPKDFDDEMEMVFYKDIYDDQSYQKLVVERNLCASDLCQVLALKNRVEKSVNWSILEYWVELSVERILEDHEGVLNSFLYQKRSSRPSHFRFIFRKDYEKYEFFERPHTYFPTDMMDIEPEDPNMNPDPEFIKNMAWSEGLIPKLFSQIFIRDEKSKQWESMYLLQRERKLYTFKEVVVLGRYYRATKTKFDEMISNALAQRNPGVKELANLSHYHVYSAINARNQLRAPTAWGVVLRPTSETADDQHSSEILCLACNSQRVRSCWVTAMRLAKYGKQLRENYRAFKNKQAETINPKDYNSFSVPNESVRSRVAMDFTGSVGRIVDDPVEAKAIAIAEGYSWKQRWRGNSRTSAGPSQATAQAAQQWGIHLTQPWFHGGMSRDQATALVGKHGTVDGVFLVRESRSNLGSFVLTYKCGGKVIHAQINPVQDPLKEGCLYSLDNGVTKFYDLLQLVEFYQLNAGCLPTRLTHYVVQNSGMISSSHLTPAARGDV